MILLVLNNACTILIEIYLLTQNMIQAVPFELVSFGTRVDLQGSGRFIFSFGDSRCAFDCNQICNTEQKHHHQDLKMVHCKKMYINSNITLKT